MTNEIKNNYDGVPVVNKRQNKHHFFSSIKHLSGGVAGSVAVVGFGATTVALFSLTLFSASMTAVSFGLLEGLFKLCNSSLDISAQLTRASIKGSVNEFKKALDSEHRGFWKAIKDENIVVKDFYNEMRIV